MSMYVTGILDREYDLIVQMTPAGYSNKVVQIAIHANNQEILAYKSNTTIELPVDVASLTRCPIPFESMLDVALVYRNMCLYIRGDIGRNELEQTPVLASIHIIGEAL